MKPLDKEQWEATEKLFTADTYQSDRGLTYKERAVKAGLLDQPVSKIQEARDETLINLECDGWSIGTRSLLKKQSDKYESAIKDWVERLNRCPLDGMSAQTKEIVTSIIKDIEG